MRMETPSAESLVQRCADLLADITAFQAYCADKRSVHVDIKHFKGSIVAEERTLQRLIATDPTAPRTIHNLRSSNLPFHEAVWKASRASCGVTAIQKRFYWEQPRKGTRRPKKKGALVDIVAQDGLEWIKLSLISENKLLFEKAKAGWEAAEYQSDDDDQMPTKIYPAGIEPPPPGMSDDDDDDDEYGRVELVKIALDLQKASQATRAHYRHPIVKLVLPNLSEGNSDIIDAILAELRATGATVICGSQASSQVQSFEKMVSPAQTAMTSTVNLDCTILLALISDLSHIKPEDVELPSKPHPSLNHQIDVEKNSPLLREILWPGIKKAKRLVASEKSIKRMWEIVHTIGTSSERARAETFFATDSSANDLRQKLQAYSIYDVPDLPLPIETARNANVDAKLAPPSVLDAVTSSLSEINRSVFMLGWMNGWTTVTSNRVAVKGIEQVLTRELNKLQANNQDDTISGPLIWTVDIARSLVGKEGGRAI